MAIIDQEGLFRGKRLRKCSPTARLYWPYLFLLSNGYARIELDYECIADEFSSFREFAPTPDKLREMFAEFRANHLLFIYKFNDQEWGQWDTRRSLLKEYKTAADKGSPAPPEPEYRRWLIEQHGNDWIEFHWDKNLAQGAPDTDSPKTLPDIDQALPKVFQQIEAEPCGVGVGVGVGTGKESKPLVHSVNEPEESSLAAESQEGEPEAPPQGGKRARADRASMATTLYNRYPRHQAKVEGIKAIEKAIVAVAKRDFDGDEKEATDWLGNKLNEYARSAQGSRPEKNLIPLPATWFNGARYDDDPEEWKYAGMGNGFVERRPAPKVPRRTALERMQDQRSTGQTAQGVLA